MERQPQKSPLPCFGLEHDKFDPKCQTCPHYDDCRLYMGNRLDKVPLNRIKFDLMPETPEHSKFNFKKDAFEMDDPELPYLQRLYTDCFYSVFSRNALDNASQYKDLIARNARKASCSVRMFMLANMVAHQVHEQAVITNTEKGRATTFRVRLLTGDLSIKRAKAYQEMCHDRFGTFSLTSLSVLTDADTSDLEATMLRSEITCHLEARTTVVLGARHTWDLGYRGELTAMQRFCPTFHYIPVVSRPDEELTRWHGHTGYVQDVWERGLIGQVWGRQPDPARCHVLLCGGPRMIESMLAVLAASGFREHTKDAPGQIHVEKYW